MYDPTMDDVIRENELFMREFNEDLKKYPGKTKRSFADEYEDVPTRLKYWMACRSESTHQGDEARILEEWTNCVIRQLCILRAGIFREPQWKKWADKLYITHCGHMLNPKNGQVVWTQKGTPRPACPCQVPGVRDP